MKKFKKFLVLGMSLALLAGCGEKKAVNNEPADTGAEKPAATENAGSVRFSWWGGDSRHEATLAALDDFKSKHKDINVDAEYAGWTGYVEKQTTQMAGGTEADLMQVNWGWLTTFSKDGSGYYDLSKLKDIIDLSNIPEKYLEQTTQNGILNAVPISTTGKVFFWNKDTWEKAGLDLPKTWEDIEKAGPIFREKLGEGYYPMDSDAYASFILSLYRIEQKTGKPFIKEDNSEVNYTVEELKESFDYYLKLVELGCMPSLVERNGYGTDTPLNELPPYVDGMYAGLYEWDSSIEKFANSLKSGPESLVVGEYLGKPDDHKAALTKISMAYAIKSKEENPEIAATLLNYLINDEDAIKIQGIERGVPISSKALKILEENDGSKNRVFAANKKVLENTSNAISPYFESEDLKTIYKDTMQHLAYGEITSEQAAKNVIEAVNNKLKEAK